jgi:cation:H+ antiporter
MAILIDSTILVLCLAIICKGATWLVDTSSKIAKRLGISELVIGLTIVAFGTSAPEFCVTISAAIRGAGNISVGNIIGSNIFNIGIILGTAAIIRNLKTTDSMVHRDGFFLLVCSVVAVGMLWDLHLSRLEGMILFSLLIFYLGNLYSSKQINQEVEIETGRLHRKDIFLLIIGLGMLLAGSHFLITSATNLARALGISEWIIGATVIAAGTSMPEIATSIIAAIRGYNGISVGNLIGSDIFNVLGALGMAAFIREMPIEVSARPSLVIYPIMVGVALFFLRTDWKLSRKEGIVLVIFGLARWAYSFMLQ